METNETSATGPKQKPWYTRWYIITIAILLIISFFPSDSETPSKKEVVPLYSDVLEEAQVTEAEEEIDYSAFEEEENNCNSNYSGCLLPNASDYDCSGGSGNGPYYTGMVQVLGYDEYDLDRDNDGWGCD